MISRNTWILIGILVVLVAAAILLPKLQQNKPLVTPTTAAANQMLFSTGQQNFTDIQLTTKDGKVVALKKSGQGQWSVTQPEGLEFDPTAVNSAGNGLVTAEVINNLAVQPPADAMGLTSPEETIKVLQTAGTTIEVKVGKLTPAGSGYYVQVADKPAVIINKGVVDDLVSLLTSGKTPTPSSNLPGSATPTP